MKEITRKQILNLRVPDSLGKAVHAGGIRGLDALAAVRLNNEGGDYPVKAPLQHRLVDSYVIAKVSMLNCVQWFRLG